MKTTSTFSAGFADVSIKMRLCSHAKASLSLRCTSRANSRSLLLPISMMTWWLYSMLNAFSHRLTLKPDDLTIRGQWYRQRGLRQLHRDSTSIRMVGSAPCRMVPMSGTLENDLLQTNIDLSTFIVACRWGLNFLYRFLDKIFQSFGFDDNNFKQIWIGHSQVRIKKDFQ